MQAFIFRKFRGANEDKLFSDMKAAQTQKHLTNRASQLTAALGTQFTYTQVTITSLLFQAEVWGIEGFIQLLGLCHGK